MKKTSKVLLVSGSRDLQDYSLVARQVGIAISDLAASVAGKDIEIIVRHGDCNSGADAHTTEFINKIEESLRQYGIKVRLERYPADWSLGKVAGPIRNKRMVNLGADLALFFFKQGANNAGTKNTLGLVKEAKIPLRLFTGE